MSTTRYGYTEAPKRQCPEITVALSHFLRQVQSYQVETTHEKPRLLHWDSFLECLRDYSWPLEPDKAHKVPPCELESFRRTHDFCAPCCLCAFLDDEEYTESRIGIAEDVSEAYIATQAYPRGEYVAVCARQRCGYVLFLERLYNSEGLKFKICFERDSPLPPQELIHISDLKKMFRSSGLFQGLVGGLLRGKGRLQSASPDEAKELRDTLVQDLNKGISESRFWSTFIQCLICKQVMFKDTMASTHECESTQSSRQHRRLHPYSRNQARRKTIIRAHVESIPGDVPQSPRSYYLSSSPAPTEVEELIGDVEERTAQDDPQHPESGDELDDWEAMDIPFALPSDTDFPPVNEVIEGVAH